MQQNEDQQAQPQYIRIATHSANSTIVNDKIQEFSQTKKTLQQELEELHKSYERFNQTLQKRNIICNQTNEKQPRQRQHNQTIGTSSNYQQSDNCPSKKHSKNASIEQNINYSLKSNILDKEQQKKGSPLKFPFEKISRKDEQKNNLNSFRIHKNYNISDYHYIQQLPLQEQIQKQQLLHTMLLTESKNAKKNDEINQQNQISGTLICQCNSNKANTCYENKSQIVVTNSSLSAAQEQIISEDLNNQIQYNNEENLKESVVSSKEEENENVAPLSENIAQATKCLDREKQEKGQKQNNQASKDFQQIPNEQAIAENQTESPQKWLKQSVKNKNSEQKQQAQQLCQKPPINLNNNKQLQDEQKQLQVKQAYDQSHNNNYQSPKTQIYVQQQSPDERQKIFKKILAHFNVKVHNIETRSFMKIFGLQIKSITNDQKLYNQNQQKPTQIQKQQLYQANSSRESYSNQTAQYQVNMSLVPSKFEAIQQEKPQQEQNNLNQSDQAQKVEIVQKQLKTQQMQQNYQNQTNQKVINSTLWQQQGPNCEINKQKQMLQNLTQQQQYWMYMQQQYNGKQQSTLKQIGVQSTKLQINNLPIITTKFKAEATDRISQGNTTYQNDLAQCCLSLQQANMLKQKEQQQQESNLIQSIKINNQNNLRYQLNTNPNPENKQQFQIGQEQQYEQQQEQRSPLITHQLIQQAKQYYKEEMNTQSPGLDKRKNINNNTNNIKNMMKNPNANIQTSPNQNKLSYEMFMLNDPQTEEHFNQYLDRTQRLHEQYNSSIQPNGGYNTQQLQQQNSDLIQITSNIINLNEVSTGKKISQKKLMKFPLKRIQHTNNFGSAGKSNTFKFGSTNESTMTKEEFFQRKLQLLRDFNFKINYSNNLFVAVPEVDLSKTEKQQQNDMQFYKVYVGRGNNSQLIKRYFKQRWWWQILDSNTQIKEANFVWTQLKVNDFLEMLLINTNLAKQQQAKSVQQQQSSSTTQHQSIESPTDESQSATQSTTTSSAASSSSQCEIQKKSCGDKEKNHSLAEQKEKKLRNLNRMRSMSQSPEKEKGLRQKGLRDIKRGDRCLEPHEKIFNSMDYKAFQKYNALYGKKEENLQHFDDLQFRLKLLGKGKQIKKITNTYQIQMHNHFESNWHLGNKKAIYYNLKQYYELNNEELFNYVPVTFHIIKGLDDKEYKNFLKFYNNRQLEIQKQEEMEEDDDYYYTKRKNVDKAHKIKKYRNIWIVKPGEITNRGNGITVCDTLYEIKQILSSNETHDNGKEKTYIVQLYIDRPFLYNRRKFDIRCYILITQINQIKRGYWYQEGYIRTSSREFTIEECGDNFIHLTNDAVQKYSEEYSKFEPGNKLSFVEFQRYLDFQYPDCKYNFFADILPQLKAIATDAIRATFMKLDTQNREQIFEIFGLDFMIDENFKPYLIECNTNPSLETTCPICTRVIPPMVENAFRIALDPLFPPPNFANWPNNKKHLAPDNILENNKFEMVFDEVEHGADILALYKNCKKNYLDDIKEMDEEEEIKSDDENNNDPLLTKEDNKDNEMDFIFPNDDILK